MTKEKTGRVEGGQTKMKTEQAWNSSFLVADDDDDHDYGKMMTIIMMITIMNDEADIVHCSTAD
jgi:hypothetical protein